MSILIISLILFLALMYCDKIIEWVFPNSTFSKIEDTTDNVMLHIGAHEDMH